MKTSLISILLFTLISISSFADDKKVTLGVQSYVKAEQLLLAFNFKNLKNWHTYWKNPGDAGLPIKIQIFIGDKEVEFDQSIIKRPAPSRYFENGNIMSYGHSGEYSLFLPLNEDLKSKLGTNLLKIHTTWLACLDICIPGKQDITGQFSGNIFVATENEHVVSSEVLIKRYNELPVVTDFDQKLDLMLVKGIDPNVLYLYYNHQSAKETDIVNNINFLTPYPIEYLTFLREQLFKDQNGLVYGRIKVEWDGEYEEPELILPKDGQLEDPITFKFLYMDPIDKSKRIISKDFQSFDITSITSLQNTYKRLTPFTNQKVKEENKSGPEGKTTNSYFYLLILAFVGGLILNIMPCVLPVISLKLFGLIKYKNESRKKIIKHNISYTLGILTTFILLAVSILALKLTGESVGWGFQLQSPRFVAFMILILFVFSLNLFGLFEFKTPFGSSIGNIKTNDSFVGDFFSGVLATILSTPCSAPFLGTALTFAFTSGYFEIFSIFIMIGLGLASPFILTAIFPKLVAFIPRPGKWMNHFKSFLGLSLLLTTLWLFDVFVSLADNSSGYMTLGTILITSFVALYFYNKVSKKTLPNIISFSLPLIFTLQLFFNTEFLINPNASSDLLKDKQLLGLNWQKWTPQLMENQIKNKNVTFIDFTAKWCFTCKINEKLVIHTKKFSDLIKEKNVTLLLADWTKRDPIIEKFLKSKGLVGIPAYFIIDKDGKLISLGETISIAKIKKYL